MKLKHGLLIAGLLLIGVVFAQESIPVPPPPGEPFEIGEDEIVDFPDVEAEFPGGNMALKKFVQKNIVYPEKARNNEDNGRVYVKFIIEKDGSITNVEVMRGGVTPELNAEAIRLVEIMPKWKPGQVGGKIVRSLCRLPFTFELL